MPDQANTPQPDGSSTLADSAAILAAGFDDDLPPLPPAGPRVVAVHDPIASLTALLGRLDGLRRELREPRPGAFIDLHGSERDRLAHRLDDIIGRAGEVWPVGARFAQVRIKRDHGSFWITLNGIPFPFALDDAEPVIVTQRAGKLSTVTLPVLAEMVDVTDSTRGVRTVVNALPEVLVDHPFAEARGVAVACPVHGSHPHGNDDGQDIGCLDCPVCFPPAERRPDTADDRDEPADPTFDHAGEAGTVPEQDDAGRPI